MNQTELELGNETVNSLREPLMTREKEQVEISLLGRLLSLEALIFLMGVVSFIYGVATLRLLNIIIGAAVLLAAALLARKLRRGRAPR